MKIHVNEKDSDKYEVINLDTNEAIRGVQYADDVNGIYEVAGMDKKGVKWCSYCGNYTTEVKQGNIKIVKKEK